MLRSKVIAATYTVICLSIVLTLPVSAQCRLVSKTKGKPNRTETLEDYQYIRTAKSYCGMSIKTIMLNTAHGQTFSLSLTYAGTATFATPGKMTFKFTDDSLMILKPVLVRLKKTDDPLLTSKVFEIRLTSTNVACFKQKQLKEIDVLFDKKDTFVTIPVDEPTFMQSQVTCLQTSLQ